MKAIRQVLRYVKGTKDYGITYKHNRGNKIYGYNDSSYGVNTQEGKGTIGIIFYYGESPISWSTQKQATVALSSCESEFIATITAATQALWLKRLLSKLTHSQEENVTIQVDNKSAITLMKNPVFHGRSKHIDTKYYFIRECVERDDIQVEFVSGEYQKADILTKALSKIKFLTMRQLIELKDLTSQRYKVQSCCTAGLDNLPERSPERRVFLIDDTAGKTAQKLLCMVFLEFVTKDDVAIIFHDDTILFQEHGIVVEKRVTDLTLNEFFSYGPQRDDGKVGKSLARKVNGNVVGWQVESDDHSCILQEAFEKVTPHVEFNIELKFDDNINYDQNHLIHVLQVILKVVHENAQDRPIIFSSFQPDAATH
ncbi:ribonuclease H-like domain, reverse transcriptase, RNA-dependent DNA polymerase [Tanacetum coccineum]